MNECIIHCDGLSHYDNPVIVTERPFKTILLAKDKHEKGNDRQIFQCKLVLKVYILKYKYHRNPCYPKFTKIICQKRADSIIKSIQNSNSIIKKSKSASKRTIRGRVTKRLSPVKRARSKSSSSPAEQCVINKRLQSFSPVLSTSSVSLSPLGSPAPAKKLCLGQNVGYARGLSEELKGNIWYQYLSLLLVLLLKLKNLQKAKYFNIAEIDLIASEFKLYKEC